MPVFWSVTTAKGVTSLPVPEVVGMATNCASLPRGGIELMRLRMSCTGSNSGSTGAYVESRLSYNNSALVQAAGALKAAAATAA